MARTDQRALPLWLIGVAVLLLIVRFTYAPPEKNTPLVRWVTPEVALDVARATGQPIMYDFTAEWCRPCHLLDAEVYADPVVAREINERFIAVRVTDRKEEDGKNSPVVDALEQRYSVRGFPTVVFVTANGSELARMEGFKGRAEFERIVERIR